MNWFTRLDGAWDVQPWGVMPQSAQLTEWLSNHPRSVLIVAGFLFVVLVVLARQLARWLPAGGAFLTNAGALIFLPYWVTTFQVDRLAGAAGVAASIACATYGCRLGMTEQHLRFWSRFAEICFPLTLGCWTASLFAFGLSGWFVGSFGAVALAVSGLLASAGVAAPSAVNRRPSPWLVGVGLVVSVICFQALRMGGPWLRERHHATTLALLATTKAVASDSPYVQRFFQRGVSLVADRVPFGSEVTHRLLHELATYGVDSIGIVTHSLTPRPDGDRESDAEIELVVRRAHLLGMKVMLKPHHRPREPDLASEASRQAWFRKHGDGIERLGRLAARIHVDLFCVGYEMGKAFAYDAECREVIGGLGACTLAP